MSGFSRSTKQLFKLVAILSFFALAACKEKHAIEGVEYEPGEVSDTSKNFKIPKELKLQIEDEYVAFMKKQGPPFDIKSKEELLLQVPREYLDVEIFMTPLATGTLTHPTKVSAVRGGGVVDLRDIVKGSKGSFFFEQKVVKNSDPSKEPEKTVVYYLSQAKRRKIGDEVYGAGCGKFMNLTKYFDGLKGRGVQVNATDQRYVSVLAGIYYFIGFEKERLFLSAVHVQDSRYPQLQCELAGAQ